MHILTLYFAHRPVVTWEVVTRLTSADCREISGKKGKRDDTDDGEFFKHTARGEAARCGIEEHRSASMPEAQRSACSYDIRR